MTWNIPLFIFASKLNSDKALLPFSPTAYLPADVTADYELVSPDPVAYIHTLESEPSHPFMTLKLYWSESRTDLQVSEWSLDELNQHGGNYTWLADLGLVSSALTPGIESAPFVPLVTSYDEARSDALTAPVNFADLNYLDPATSYRYGHRIGYAHQSKECNFCDISMSEAFPSAGGADCPFLCENPATMSSHGLRYDLGYIKSAPAVAFDEQMKKAGEILLEYGDASITYGSGLHMSLNYFCCYSDADFAVIDEVIHEMEWPAINVTFDYPVWRIDSDYEAADHYSAIVMLDEPSQAAMGGLVREVEDKIRARGVDVHVPRDQQEPFHSTLAVVSGKAYPSATGINAVNAAIEPGSGAWTKGLGPITLPPPVMD